MATYIHQQVYTCQGIERLRAGDDPDTDQSRAREEGVGVLRDADDLLTVLRMKF
jgi:hypothetical protein